MLKDKVLDSKNSKRINNQPERSLGLMLVFYKITMDPTGWIVNPSQPEKHYHPDIQA